MLLFVNALVAVDETFFFIDLLLFSVVILNQTVL